MKDKTTAAVDATSTISEIISQLNLTVHAIVTTVEEQLHFRPGLRLVR